MGDDHSRHAGMPAGILQQAEHGFTGLVVERTGRLVTQQELGVLCQCSCDGNTLLLTAGELRREILHALSQTHLPQHRFRIERIPADLCGKLDIFFGSQVAHQIVELEHESHVIPTVGSQLLFIIGRDLGAVQPRTAAGEGVHAAEDVEDGGLAGAGRPDDHTEFPSPDLKADIMQRFDLQLARPIDLPDILKFHKSAHIPFLSDMLS